jgi:chemotaxis protein MotB
VSRRRPPAGGGGHEGADERWLLTYSDMITLLMTLFIVLWSISSVNVSKLRVLQASLSNAFSSRPVLTGGPAVLNGSPTRIQGVQTQQNMQPSVDNTSVLPRELTNPIEAASARTLNAAAKREEQSLEQLRREIQNYAKKHGFASQIRTTINQRGLVIRLLTDNILFDSGQADIKPRALPLIQHVSDMVLQSGITNPIRIEGNTDNVPLNGGPYHDNWGLSAARAVAVLEQLLAAGLPAHRLSEAGYADTLPIASNATTAGRAQNRRVDVVVLRQYQIPQGVSK